MVSRNIRALGCPLGPKQVVRVKCLHLPSALTPVELAALRSNCVRRDKDSPQGRMTPDRGRKSRSTEKLPGVPAYLGESSYFIIATFGSIKLFDELRSRSLDASRIADTNVASIFGNLVKHLPIDVDFLLKQFGYRKIRTTNYSFIR